jgi:hypothetical protein
MMDIVMMSTTKSNVSLILAIVATITILTNMHTVIHVANVPSWMKLLVCTIGLVMDIVMMSTTMPNVSLILVIVATMTIPTNTCTVTPVMNVRS